MLTFVSEIRIINLVFTIHSICDEVLSRNLELYALNSTIHGFNIRNKLQLHKPSTTLTIYQKGAYYDSIKIFNKMPDHIAESDFRKKCFISNLRKYLIDKAFFSNEEHMNS